MPWRIWKPMSFLGCPKEMSEKPKMRLCTADFAAATTADILHLNFAGIRVRVPSGEADYTVEYDALSDPWASGEMTATITCKNVNFPITGNLFQALRIFWSSQRHILVNAVCTDST